MIDDPIFYAFAVPAVILVGLSKGGFGGAFALLGVPLMSLAISPVKAAAIMLPILILMDMVSLWAWRSHSDRMTLYIMLPGALVGITIGWATAAWVTDAMIRLIVGLVALWFVWRYVAARIAAGRGGSVPPRPHRKGIGAFWGMIAGFTSFVSHAGGPPYQIYTLPLRQDPRVFTGSSVRFFATINAVKVIPYFALGQFDAQNLKAAATLAPIAPLATLAGAMIVKRMKPDIFYPFMYGMVTLTALKLVYDGSYYLMLG